MGVPSYFRRYWPLVLATASAVAVNFGGVALLLSKVGEMIGGVFDTSVPFYPQVGLFFVLVFLLLRRREIARGLQDKRRVAVLQWAAFATALIPAAILLGPANFLTGSFVAEGVAVAVSWFGFVVALRPSLFRILVPYLVVYVVAVVSVNAIQTVVGDPLASIVAVISSGGTALAGLPVTWHASYFTFTTLGGVPMSLYISDACSGIASVSIFLLLLALMHVDLRAKPSTTLAAAALGTVALVFLNALRVVVVVWGGYVYGPDTLWSLHGWLGYAIYLAFFTVAVVLYTRSAALGVPAPSTESLGPGKAQR
jgi:exosortase/archaeosortase family protein